MFVQMSEDGSSSFSVHLSRGEGSRSSDEIVPPEDGCSDGNKTDDDDMGTLHVFLFFMAIIQLLTRNSLFLKRVVSPRF